MLHELESADRKRHKCKMRWLRLKQSHPVHHHSTDEVPQAPCLSTPRRSRTRYQLRSARRLISPHAKKSLLFHNVMVDQLTNVMLYCVVLSSTSMLVLCSLFVQHKHCAVSVLQFYRSFSLL